MPSVRRLKNPGSSGAAPARALIAALLALMLWASWAPPAAAQNPIADFFGSLFTPRGANPPSERRAHKRNRRPQAPAAARRAPNSETAPPNAPGNAAQAPKAPPSFFIAVIGDSQANLLAGGLAQAFADDPRVAILNHAREDTGLVRDDFYDWRAAAKALADGQQHIDVAVMQIGINDDQKFREPDLRGLEPLSKSFNEIYAKRVDELARIFRD